MSQFGAFLVKEGLVTPEQVLEALSRQRALQRPIGEIAVGNNMLTREQVFETLNHQVTGRKRFGELVMELGLGHITEHDITRLLSIQREERPAIGTILVEMGVIDFEIMTSALNKFFNQRA